LRTSTVPGVPASASAASPFSTRLCRARVALLALGVVDRRVQQVDQRVGLRVDDALALVGRALDPLLGHVVHHAPHAVGFHDVALLAQAVEQFDRGLLADGAFAVAVEGFRGL